MSKPLVNGAQQYYGPNGALPPFGKLFSFAAGTNTPQNTYTDQGAGTPNANPTILDANGHANIWITNQGYKFQLQTATGTILWTVDNVYLTEPGAVTSRQIAPGAVGTAQFAANPIGTAQISIGAITTALLAPLSVTTSKFAAGAVTFVCLDPAIDLSLLNNMAEVVEKRTNDLSGGVMNFTPQYPYSAPTKLSNPVTLPNSGNAVAWSPDGRFLAVGEAGSPFIGIYERSGTVLTKLPNPGTLPTGAVAGVAWSPNGDFLACFHATSPFITLYQRQGINFTKLADPAQLPPRRTLNGAFSPNGEFLFVSSQSIGIGSSSILYQIQGTIFSFVSSSAPSSGGNSALTWSADSQYLLIAGTANDVAIWQRNGSVFTTPGNVFPTPAGFPSSLSWSPDGQFLAVGMITAPFLSIYQYSGGTFNLLTAPATMPANSVNGVAFSPDGQSLAVAFIGTPFFYVYSISGTTFNVIANPASLPVGDCTSISWSPSAQFLSMGVIFSPFFTTYNSAGTFPAKPTLFSRDFLDV